MKMITTLLILLLVSTGALAFGRKPPPTADTTPPSVPANLKASQVAIATLVTVALSWTPSTDNIAVTGYKVLRDSAQIGTAAGATFTDKNAAQGTTYKYTVQAFDAVGNTSGASQPAVILTGMNHGTPPPAVAQAPGPSIALFNSPYYSCVRNFYVNASTGNDSRTAVQAQSPATPWLTIGKYDATATAAGGDCINVAPGTYANGAGSSGASSIQQGGTAATPTGYVTYRCTTPAFISGSGCIIDGTGAISAFSAGCLFTGSACAAGSAWPNYLIFDGFNMVSTVNVNTANAVGVKCVGLGTFASGQTTSLGCHHWWIINNVISGWGLAGVANGDTEYWYISHNKITKNVQQGCNGFYGSGIGLVVAKPVSGYVRVADDNNSGNNAALNLMGAQGPSFPFSYLVGWNEIGNNFQGCSPFNSGNSDGNGVIIDTFIIAQNAAGTIGCNKNLTNYPGSTLVAFNAIYNSGGKGIHLFASANTIVANNSTFNNALDMTQVGFTRNNINVSCGQGLSTGTPPFFASGTNMFFNNIAYSIQQAGGCTFDPSGPNQSSFSPFGVSGEGVQAGDAIYNGPTSGRNISFIVGATGCGATGGNENSVDFFGGGSPNPAWSCSDNKCATNPLFVNVGNSSAGTESTAPVGTNFAIQGISPAIGYGLTKTYLPAQSVDVGACHHTLTTCP